MEDDPSVQKISIRGPTLAMIMQRFAASNADCDGLLFGHLRSISSPNLADDDDQIAVRQDLVATITGCTTCAFPQSFYDAVGRIDHVKLAKFVGERNTRNQDPLIGWFVARRNTPLRPSMREAAVTSSLRSSNNAQQNHSPSRAVSAGSGVRVSDSGLQRSASSRVSKEGLGLPYSPESSSDSQSMRSPRREKGVVKDKGVDKGKLQVNRVCGIPASSPCVFLIFSESFAQHSIHTHEYRAFQYRSRGQRGVFEVKSVDVVNIGPGFRSLYSAFSPVSSFPMLPSSFEDAADKQRGGEGRNWQKSDKVSGAAVREQGILDMYSLGYSVDRFGKLIRSDAIHVVSEVEDLYGGMISRLEHLAKQVAESSQAVAEQEKHNMKLRNALAGIE